MRLRLIAVLFVKVLVTGSLSIRLRSSFLPSGILSDFLFLLFFSLVETFKFALDQGQEETVLCRGVGSISRISAVRTSRYSSSCHRKFWTFVLLFQKWLVTCCCCHGTNHETPVCCICNCVAVLSSSRIGLHWFSTCEDDLMTWPQHTSTSFIDWGFQWLEPPKCCMASCSTGFL